MGCRPPAYSINKTLTWAIMAQKGKSFSMRTYRRKRGSDTWHFCRNCTEWPMTGYEEQTNRPTSGELCNQCRSKETNGTCSQ